MKVKSEWLANSVAIAVRVLPSSSVTVTFPVVSSTYRGEVTRGNGIDLALLRAIECVGLIIGGQCEVRTATDRNGTSCRSRTSDCLCEAQ